VLPKKVKFNGDPDVCFNNGGPLQKGKDELEPFLFGVVYHLHEITFLMLKYEGSMAFGCEISFNFRPLRFLHGLQTQA